MRDCDQASPGTIPLAADLLEDEVKTCPPVY